MILVADTDKKSESESIYKQKKQLLSDAWQFFLFYLVFVKVSLASGSFSFAFALLAVLGIRNPFLNAPQLVSSWR